jgi:polo-like kinase 1
MNRDLAINSRPASAMSALPMMSKNDTENIQPMQQHFNAAKLQISSPAPPPEIIEHRISENGRTVVKRYFKGELLGKGGFAKCFLFTDCESNEKWACKVRSCASLDAFIFSCSHQGDWIFLILSYLPCSPSPPQPPQPAALQVVNKDTLKKPRHKAKLESEIKIHMKLKHPHVVYLHDAFEDKDNVYLLMELCEAQTLLELVKRKKRLADCVRHSSLHIFMSPVSHLIFSHRMCAGSCTSC